MPPFGWSAFSGPRTNIQDGIAADEGRQSRGGSPCLSPLGGFMAITWPVLCPQRLIIAVGKGR